MLCGNTAALNNYEIEQDQLERTAAFSDSAEIARDLLNGGEYLVSNHVYSVDTVIEHVEEDDDYRGILKNLALNVNNSLEQVKFLQQLNALIRENAFCVAEIMES